MTDKEFAEVQSQCREHIERTTFPPPANEEADAVSAIAHAEYGSSQH